MRLSGLWAECSPPSSVGGRYGGHPARLTPNNAATYRSVRCPSIETNAANPILAGRANFLDMYQSWQTPQTPRNTDSMSAASANCAMGAVLTTAYVRRSRPPRTPPRSAPYGGGFHSPPDAFETRRRAPRRRSRPPGLLTRHVDDGLRTSPTSTLNSTCSLTGRQSNIVVHHTIRGSVSCHVQLDLRLTTRSNPYSRRLIP